MSKDSEAESTSQAVTGKGSAVEGNGSNGLTPIGKTGRTITVLAGI